MFCFVCLFVCGARGCVRECEPECVQKKSVWANLKHLLTCQLDPFCQSVTLIQSGIFRREVGGTNGPGKRGKCDGENAGGVKQREIGTARGSTVKY